MSFTHSAIQLLGMSRSGGWVPPKGLHPSFIPQPQLDRTRTMPAMVQKVQLGKEGERISVGLSLGTHSPLSTVTALRDLGAHRDGASQVREGETGPGPSPRPSLLPSLGHPAEVPYHSAWPTGPDLKWFGEWGLWDRAPHIVVKFCIGKTLHIWI